jgi:hypothetical protein
MVEETITLREAARCLARIRNPKGNNIESSRLLSLLRSGELRAGFYFFRGTVWIEIPLTHWQGIDANKFRIGRKPNDPNSGTYKIKANAIPDQVANVLSGLIARDEEQQTKPILQEITEVVSESAINTEVTIKMKDFSDHLQRHSPEESTTTTHVGRKQKESWRDICSYMAAYMLAHYKPGLTAGDSAKEIVELAKADGVGDPPSAATLKEQVSKMIDLLNKPTFKPKN